MALFSWLKKKEAKPANRAQNAGGSNAPGKKTAPKAKPAKAASRVQSAGNSKKPVKSAKAAQASKPVSKPAPKPVAKAVSGVRSAGTGKKPASVQKAESKAPAQTPQPSEPAKKLSNSELRERMERGWLKVLITFELAGKPKEHIEGTLKAYVENVKGDQRIAALSEEFADAIEHEDGIWSAFCEMEALVMNLETLTWIAINFMPAAIEVLEPERPELESRDVTAWLNDLLAKLHETSALVRQERSVRDGMTTSLNALIKNAILACLKSGAKTGAELESLLGISFAQLEPFLQHFIEKEKVVKDGETYTLAQ